MFDGRLYPRGRRTCGTLRPRACSAPRPLCLHPRTRHAVGPGRPSCSWSASSPSWAKRAAACWSRSRPRDDAALARLPPTCRVRRGAHHAAHARGARPVAALHLHLRDARRQEPARGAAAGAAARLPAVGADPRLHLDHGRVLHVARAGAGAGRRIRRRSSRSSPARPGTWRSASTSRCAPCRPSWPRRRTPSSCRRGCGSGGSRCRSPCRR